MQMQFLLSFLGAACIVFSLAENGEWIEGRATYFDAPDYWKDPFMESQFGDLYGNSCGYVNRKEGVQPSNADFPFPFDAVGALADVNADFPGFCGRCYEVRCKSGFIKWNETTNIKWNEILKPSDVAPYLKDPEGRSWPGQPDIANNRQEYYTNCWDEDKSIFITIVDACPCNFIGGRKQRPCCGPVPHINLSFWAFNALAHPLYGLMMLNYRPVDCDTHEPLDFRKPYVSSVIYGDKPEAGWSWRAWYERESRMMVAGAGRKGSNATCVNVSGGGGLAFLCRKCEKEGFQPFSGKTAVQFWIRSNSAESTSNTATPRGKAPPLQMFLSQFQERVYTESGTHRDPEIFCGQKIGFKDRMPQQTDGDWFQFRIDLADFQCSGNITPDTVNRVAIANPTSQDASFCVDDVELV